MNKFFKNNMICDFKPEKILTIWFDNNQELNNFKYLCSNLINGYKIIKRGKKPK